MLFLAPFPYLSVYRPADLSFYPSTHLNSYLSIYLGIFLSSYLSIYHVYLRESVHRLSHRLPGILAFPSIDRCQPTIRVSIDGSIDL